MISDEIFCRFYGDGQLNGTRIFYDWIRASLGPDSIVLNLGAGPPTRQKIRVIKGEIAHLVGADIDPAVLENDELDEAVVVKGDGRLPFPDGRFDCVFSDYVLEHVENPCQFLDEVKRVLKPGGSFFFRTPNIYHYVTLISMLTPHALHQVFANRLRGLGDDVHEPWETHYKMNTRRRLAALAHDAGFQSTELRTIEAEPSYLMFHPIPFYFGVAYERLVNSTDALSGLRVNILGRCVS